MWGGHSIGLENNTDKTKVIKINLDTDNTIEPKGSWKSERIYLLELCHKTEELIKSSFFMNIVSSAFIVVLLF